MGRENHNIGNIENQKTNVGRIIGWGFRVVGAVSKRIRDGGLEGTVLGACYSKWACGQWMALGRSRTCHQPPRQPQPATTWTHLPWRQTSTTSRTPYGHLPRHDTRLIHHNLILRYPTSLPFKHCSWLDVPTTPLPTRCITTTVLRNTVYTNVRTRYSNLASLVKHGFCGRQRCCRKRCNKGSCAVGCRRLSFSTRRAGTGAGSHLCPPRCVHHSFPGATSEE